MNQVQKTIEYMISFKVKLFRDAYRKGYQLHALLYNSGLYVNKIEMHIDEESWLFDDKTEHFPFLFSMIKKKSLELNESWKNIIDAILLTPKSKQDTDLRFCAAFSYLAAKNREYSIDRFTNLWTAMNGYGNYIAKCYENCLETKFDFENVSNKSKNTLLLYGKDGRIVNIISLLIKRPITLHSVANQNELWKNYYGIQNALTKISDSEYRELYDEAWKAIDDSYILPEKFSELGECAEYFSVPLFILLVVYYPYQLRCHYLHGSYSTLLFSAYNDYEVASLGVVNYFIERFLNQKIPELFEKDFWNDDKQNELIECMRIAVGPKDYNKEYEKLIERSII